MVPDVVEIRVKSVLNRVSGMPFRWSMNPYRGCVHGCVFCYARRTHWFIEEDGVGAWSTRIFVKVNAPEVLQAELARRGWRRERIALGTSTDPYQGVEARYGITRRLLEVTLRARTPLSIVTRSPLVERDLDLLAEHARRAGLTVALSIATLDAALAREIEPTVSPPERRLAVVARLAERGIRAGVFLAPILPGITDDAASLARVLEGAREAGASFVHHGLLHLGEVTRDAYFTYLERRRPDLLPRYRELYAGAYAPARAAQEIDDRVAAAQTRFPCSPRGPHLSPPPEAEQLALL
ncbi:MAG TPA: radical SAM protein [Candidatus Dormibacteraeota bacterium]|nr:radical SAM protein [Candidatus Dormibacteraeota bacterium]